MQDDTFKQRRKRVIVILAIVFVVIPIAVSIYLMLTKPEKPVENRPEHIKPVVILENSFQLTVAIGQTLADKISGVISTELLKESEINSAPSPNNTENIPSNAYLATVTEDSFSYFSEDESNVAFFFDLTVSDGRTYRVYVHTSGISLRVQFLYLVVIIKRTDKVNENNSAYIYYEDEEQLLDLRRIVENNDSRNKIILEEQLDIK